MSRYLQHNEQVYELFDTELQRLQRRAKLKVVYAIVDPDGWDARRLIEGGSNPLILWMGLKEVYASQQEADHPGAGLAGHVSEGQAAHDEERVPAGLP